jgi:hypothetical protein
MYIGMQKGQGSGYKASYQGASKGRRQYEICLREAGHGDVSCVSLRRSDVPVSLTRYAEELQLNCRRKSKRICSWLQE